MRTTLQIVPSLTPSSVRQVSPDDVLREWPRVEPLLTRALGEGSYSSSDVARGCLMGGWVLWVAERGDEIVGICITEIIDFPRQRKCLMRYLSGDLDAIFEHAPRIEAYAAVNGCQMLEAYARKGLARMTNWTQKYVILQKELI